MTIVCESMCVNYEKAIIYMRLSMQRVQRNHDKGVSWIVKFSKTLLGMRDKMGI